MSKFRVRTSFGESIRPVELNRGDNASSQYASLREQAGKKHELNNFQLKFVSASMGEVLVVDGESFTKVLRDADLRQVPQIDIRVVSSEKQPPVTRSSGINTSPSTSSHSPSPSSSSSTSSRSSYAPPTSPTSHSTPSSRDSFSSSPASTSHAQGEIATYTLPADSNSSNPDKVAVKANQEDDHFLFIPQPAKYQSEVRVVLEGSKLSFMSTTQHPDGRVFQFTQGFSLPFSTIPANTIEVQGYNIKISF